MTGEKKTMPNTALVAHNAGDTVSYQLTGGWTDTTTTGTNLLIGDPWISQPWVYPIYNHFTTICHCHWFKQPKIRLDMAEVNTLRRAAKKDKKLKDVLEQFTDYIEVIMEFD